MRDSRRTVLLVPARLTRGFFFTKKQPNLFRRVVFIAGRTIAFFVAFRARLTILVRLTRSAGLRILVRIDVLVIVGIVRLLRTPGSIFNPAGTGLIHLAAFPGGLPLSSALIVAAALLHIRTFIDIAVLFLTRYVRTVTHPVLARVVFHTGLLHILLILLVLRLAGLACILRLFLLIGVFHVHMVLYLMIEAASIAVAISLPAISIRNT